MSTIHRRPLRRVSALPTSSIQKPCFASVTAAVLTSACSAPTLATWSHKTCRFSRTRVLRTRTARNSRRVARVRRTIEARCLRLRKARRPSVFPRSSVRLARTAHCHSGGPQGNVSPRIRPTTQRLPTIDQWNATIQRQVTPTLNVSVGYVGNKGTHVFAGNGPSYNTNEAAIGGGTFAYGCYS